MHIKSTFSRCAQMSGAEMDGSALMTRPNGRIKCPTQRKLPPPMPYLNAVYCISEKMELRSFHFTQAVHSRHSKNAFRKKNVVPLFQRPRLTHIHLFMFYGALPHSGDRWAGAEPSGHLWTGYQPTAEHVQYCINKPITHRIHTQGQFWVEKEPKHTCAWSVSWVFNQALFCFVLFCFLRAARFSVNISSDVTTGRKIPAVAKAWLC